MPDADPSFCEACARVTGGNPFLLAELAVEATPAPRREKLAAFLAGGGRKIDQWHATLPAVDVVIVGGGGQATPMQGFGEAYA